MMMAERAGGDRRERDDGGGEALRAERDLRKAKRHSKVTGGFRDDRGMEACCTALTVTETMHCRGIDVFARDADGPPGR